MRDSTVIAILVMLLFLLSLLPLINAFEKAPYEGREFMFRQAITGYNLQDKILNLPLVRGTRNEKYR